MATMANFVTHILCFILYCVTQFTNWEEIRDDLKGKKEGSFEDKPPEFKSCHRRWLDACVCVCAKSLSCVWLFVTPMDCSPLHNPLSMGFSRQEYWSVLPCPLPGDLPDWGMEPVALALWQILYCWTSGEAWLDGCLCLNQVISLNFFFPYGTDKNSTCTIGFVVRIKWHTIWKAHGT